MPRGPWAPDAPLDAELLVQRCHDSVSVAHLAGQAADLFAGLPRGKAARLTETLEALLASRHRTATEVATALGIHAQTARYRLRQLDLILGDRLDDPQFRLRIQLSLRADRLRRGFPGQSSQ
ncbi:helix-turn-helix domain-containing protein [Saccharothrix deserti]|uniref:helix-turn-helix domain-containing protein n=1 Tax=Saccharothrix deserti TaxID=2593674 RepID=UPI00131C37CC|nr:helix-turn-helix domain-containing protein [Saccharothrix deserti]